MYQYSLEWFIGIFLNSIANADASGTPRELLFIAIDSSVLFNPSLWPESHWPTFFWCVIYNLGKKFSGHRLSYCLRNPCPSTMLFGEGILQARNAGYSCGGKDGALVRALASHHCGLVQICGLSFLFGSLPCSESFFSGFPLYSKTSISKFQFD